MMDRKFSVRYRPANTTVAGNDVERTSWNTYDRDTDSNIFALGDAAQDAGINLSQMDQMDEIFKGFGFDINSALQQQFEADSKGMQPPPLIPTIPEDGSVQMSTQTMPIKDGSSDNNVQVTTIQKTLPDGKTVQTRIIRGPIQKRTRIIKVNRELPNGETELLGTFEAPYGENVDLTGAISSALSSTLQPGSVSVVGKPEVNVLSSGHESIPSIGKIPEQPKHIPNLPTDMPFADESTPPKSPTSPKPLPSPTSKVFSGRDIGSEPTSPAVKSPPGLQARVSPTQITPKPRTMTPGCPSIKSPLSRQGTFKGSQRKSIIPDEDAIQLYKPSDETPHERDIDDAEKGQWLKCCPAIWSRKKNGQHDNANEFSKGRLGMTQFEINSDEKLPALTALVANYARMLFEDRARFVQTLFRAVKLNNLDVVKILCKILQKSGLKLSSKEIREPESSATILHVALLYNYQYIVDYLISSKDSELIMAKYENEEYRNQTGLHVAVANGNPEMVEKLLLPLNEDQRQVLINTVADGRYFKNKHPHGQLCLTAAAWAGRADIIKMLVYHGGNLTLKSHHGNTLLHSIVIQSAFYPDRSNYEAILTSVWDATRIWAEQMSYGTKNAKQRALEEVQIQTRLFKELLSIRNNDGYTPLALATDLNSKLFKFLINLENIYKIPQNKLGSITWVTYDVTDISSFSYDTYNKFSVLHILAHNSDQLSRHASLEGRKDDEDYLDIEPISALIACKWKVYRIIYILWLMVHLSYMIIFTACTVESNTSPFPNDLTNNNSNATRANASKCNHNTNGDPPPTTPPRVLDESLFEVQFGFTFFLILPLVYIGLEILDIFGNKPYRIQFMAGQNYLMRGIKSVKSEWTITGNGPYRLVNIGFSYFLIDWFFLYVTRDPNQDIALAMALLLGWVYVLFFTRACRVTCRFAIMIQKMFFRDLIYFLTVYGIILIGFSFAMNSMFTYYHNADITISKVFYDMMNVVTDLDKKQTIDDARHVLFAKLLLIFYAIVAVILLMNMLIAMMNTSYETVRVTRCNLWRQQQLSIMLMIERRFFWWRWLCRKSERDVWRKDEDAEWRCYLDVTVLHTSSYKTNQGQEATPLS